MASDHSQRRIIGGRFTIALAVATALMVMGVLLVNYVIDAKLNRVRRIAVKTAPAPAKGSNFLLLAADTQTIDDLADTIMVVHVEPGARRTLVMSFPRDLWVDIPGQGMAKINAATAHGPNQLIATLKTDFNIDINHFLFVNFKAFQGVVNAIGTVPVYFPYPARDPATGLALKFGGCVPLDGLSALQYTRSRALEYFNLTTKQWLSADSIAPDIGRIARQQQFIRELASIAVQRSLNDPLTANDIADRVIGDLTFDQNLSKNDLLAIIDAFRTINTNSQSSLDFETLPWQPGPNQGSQSVLYAKEPDDQPLLARLRDFTGSGTSGSPVVPGAVQVQVVDATGRAGTGQGALDDLVRRAGFTASGPAATAATQFHTTVRYKQGAFAKGDLVLEYLQPQARLVEDPTLKADVSVTLGRDFHAIVVPATAPSPPAGNTPPTTTPAPLAPSTNAQNAGQAVDPTVFGPPVPKAAPCR